jgi:uncharacterized protein YoxC
MAGPLVDETRALSVVRFVVYRQKGGSVQWDGSAFSGLDARPVGLQVGLAVAQHLRQTGVTVDEGAKTIGQNLEKLVRGRLQAVVALEGESQPLVEHLSDRIEVLPKAFDATRSICKSVRRITAPTASGRKTVECGAPCAQTLAGDVASGPQNSCGICLIATQITSHEFLLGRYKHAIDPTIVDIKMKCLF